MVNRRYYLSAVTAFSIWGFFPVALRMIQEYPPGSILFFRILCSAVCLLAILFFFKRGTLVREIKRFRELHPGGRMKVSVLTVSGAILLTLNWLVFIHVVNNVNVRTASFAYLICPVITAALGYLLLKERLTYVQWVSVGLCAFSCVLLGLQSSAELAYSFTTALTYALYLISQRKNQGFDRMVMLGIQMFISLAILTIFSGALVSQVPLFVSFYAVIVIIALLFTILPLFLNLFALNGVNSATIGILMYLNPLISFTLAVTLFNETLNYIQVIGYSVITCALILFNLSHIRQLAVFQTRKR